MKTNSPLTKFGACLLLVLLGSLTSCEDILEQYFPKPNPTPPTIPTFPPLGQDITFYALSGGNRLDAFSTANPGTRTGSVAITGLGSGETLLAIDFRPATGQLYGVSSASRVYVINQNTGVARTIGTGAFTPALESNLVGIDFNPIADQIRVVTSTRQNLRLNPETGTVVAVDGTIGSAGGGDPALTGIAQANNVAGTNVTTLYGIDIQSQSLYRVTPPNNGSVIPGGKLNLNISGNGGFDIDARTGTALGLYPVNGSPTLFTVDLTTGAAQPLAQYAANSGYTGLAIPTRPVGYATRSVFQGQLGVVSTLHIFDLTRASDEVSKIITGLAANEFTRGLDFRPATGQLYALTSISSSGQPDRNRLYTINTGTGAATFVAELSTPVVGGGIGFDFNPVADRIRIVNAAGQNLRVNPVDGVVIEDSGLVPGAVGAGAAAYDNNFAGATATNLYVIGNTTDKLYQQNPPNAGTLVEIGSLGLPEDMQLSDLDIGGTTNTAYALLRLGTTTRLYTVNKTTGAATAISEPIVPTGFISSGFAIGLGF